MKTSSQNQGSRFSRPATRRRREHGFLVIALLAIMAIMLIYVNANVRLLGHLRRELKLVEQKQIQRLERIGAQPLRLTNTVTAAATELAAPPSK